jgi:hypothetical protein
MLKYYKIGIHKKGRFEKILPPVRETGAIQGVTRNMKTKLIPCLGVVPVVKSLLTLAVIVVLISLVFKGPDTVQIFWQLGKQASYTFCIRSRFLCIYMFIGELWVYTVYLSS